MKKISESGYTYSTTKKMNLSTENIIFTICNTLFLLLLCVIMLYPMLNTLAISFNEATDSIKGGIYLWPRKFSLRNYEVVFNMHTITSAFMMSVWKLIANVITNLVPTTMLAYALSKKDYVFNKPVTILFVATMYFSAGLIPSYIFMRSLGLLNTFTVYWLPVMISTFNVIVIRTYIRGLPDSLMESAKIDGASEFRVLLQIVTPLITPVLATITLFVAVGSWNDWFSTFIYASQKPELSVLQYEMYKLINAASSNASSSQASAATQAAQATAGTSTMVTPMALRAAITMVTAVPILVVYPFLQRYFVVGLTIGGVKE
jgi:putative aldouronate transport system permease protein